MQPAMGILGFLAFGVDDELVAFVVQWKGFAADLPADSGDGRLASLFVAFFLELVEAEGDGGFC